MAETKKSTATKSKAKSKSAEEKEKIRQKELEQAEKLHKKKRLHDEIWAIVIIALGVLVVLSLHTKAIGMFGTIVSAVLCGLFGQVAYVLAYFLIVYGILIFLNKTSYLTLRSLICMVVLFAFACILNYYRINIVLDGFGFNLIKMAYTMGPKNAGVFGCLLGSIFSKMVGKTGMLIISICGIVICLMFIIDTPISIFFDNLKIKRQAVKKTREVQLAENEAILAREKEIREEMALEEPVHVQEHAPAKKSNAADYTHEKVNVPEPAEEQMTVEEIEPQPEEKQLPVFNPNLTPESIGLTSSDEYNNRQKQILDYMQDDNLFGKVVPKTPGYGLDGDMDMNGEPEIVVPAAGFIPRDVTPTNTPEPAPVYEAPAPIEKGPYETEELEINRSKPHVALDEPFTAAEKVRRITPAEAAAVTAELSKAAEAPAEPVYRFPSLDLLRKPMAGKAVNDSESLAEKARVLEETLASFGVTATVEDMVKGPTVTRFEVHPAAGVKVSKIVSLQDDLALNLRAKSLRIEAPIPGKAAVGIEITNETSSSVSLREVLESKEFQTAKSKISVGLGKNVTGQSIVANLKSMPHLLIAGSTGSGKSVCINSIILSLLYKATPEEVKLIMVDPKVVELSNYNGIPHLLIPVVTDPPKASAALGWAVSEMNDRYNKFANEQVRDLESYNDVMRSKIAEGDTDAQILPQIVIIIDELADLIMAAQNAVEDSICRLAQKARAAGMHMIIATQRPSADVITGVIKANIPSRIAFAVSSSIDSRVILDMTGAEKLVGKGDMLYYPQGMPKPERVQGCFVSDEEVNRVIDAIKIKDGSEDHYSSDLRLAISKPGSSAGGGAAEDNGNDEDELLADAVECVVRAEQASVSMLQRRFRIGYNRAARLIDLMEERGIVGPADGQRPRKVLLSVEQFEVLENESTKALEVEEEIY